MLTREGLLRVKTRALRRGIWFRITSRLERGIVDLTMRCVERIRSPFLVSIVSEIVRKIKRTLENCFLKMAEKVGVEIAKRICEIALGWGNETASSWKHDVRFVRFLGVSAIDTVHLETDYMIGEAEE